MGSDSDLPVMQKAADAFDDFGVRYRMTVASAHRSPEYVKSFIAEAEKDGVGVVICAAGMAAHLAGAVAGMTTRPVIGVPMGSKLSGFDSLLSTVQMPKGVPVATVAIDGAANAAILAVQILALEDDTLAAKLVEHKKSMETAVLKKAAELNNNAHA
jgi:5-(carboxyamino)imidazole ribonucleotide mutase